jgi:hypothetical protein
VQVASRGCGSPVCLHTSWLGTAGPDRDDGTDRATTVQEVCDSRQKSNAHPIRQIAESIIRTNEGESAVLPETAKRAGGEEDGFKVNPYGPCVANKMTDSGKQMTFVLHMGNLMGLCEDDFELTKLLCYLAKIYGSKLTMHTGHKHNYLGVNMEFRKDGTLGVYMIPYLKNVIAEFPEISK